MNPIDNNQSKNTIIPIKISNLWDNVTESQYQSGLYLSHRFTGKDITRFWEVFMSDPLTKKMYADTLPRDLARFLLDTKSETKHFWMLYLYGRVAGAAWLHDLNSYDGIQTAWLALYHLPPFRRLIGTLSTEAAILAASQLGIDAIFAGCRSSNHNARRHLDKAGFLAVGTYDKFAPFDGVWDDVIVYSRREQDREECWRQTRMRASAMRVYAGFVNPDKD